MQFYLKDPISFLCETLTQTSTTVLDQDSMEDKVIFFCFYTYLSYIKWLHMICWINIIFLFIFIFNFLMILWDIQLFFTKGRAIVYCLAYWEDVYCMIFIGDVYLVLIFVIFPIYYVCHKYIVVWLCFRLHIHVIHKNNKKIAQLILSEFWWGSGWGSCRILDWGFLDHIKWMLILMTLFMLPLLTYKNKA